MGKRWGSCVLPRLFPLFLGLWAAAAVAWGTEGAFPPQWEEEPPASLSDPGEEPPVLSEADGWQDWEEDWNGAWDGAASGSPGEEAPAPDWEPWEEEEQDRTPQWGPALTDPAEGPAFPEELPPDFSSASEPPVSKVPKAPVDNNEKAAKPKAGSRRDTVTPGENGTPGADFPGLLPHRVTEDDLPREGEPLWHRAADPHILWILLVAASLVILGLRILWGRGGEESGREKYDDREPIQEKWEV